MQTSGGKVYTLSRNKIMSKCLSTCYSSSGSWNSRSSFFFRCDLSALKNKVGSKHYKGKIDLQSSHALEMGKCIYGPGRIVLFSNDDRLLRKCELALNTKITIAVKLISSWASISLEEANNLFIQS